MGPLLGPFFVILNHGIRQGGRSAVQLFGAFAKGLADAVHSSSVGPGIGHDSIVNPRRQSASRWLKRTKLGSTDGGLSKLHLTGATTYP